MTLPLHLLKRGAFTVATALSLIAPAAALPDLSLYGDTLMWRLEPPGGGAPSYIVGTIHLADPRLQPSIDRALERLDETGALVVETDMSDAVMAAIAPRMLLADGRTLQEVIGDDQFARLGAIVAELGMPQEALLQFAPWAVTMMLSLPAEHMEEIAAGELFFDQRLVASAEERALPVATLEPIEEQIAALADYTEDEQVAILATAIDHYPELQTAMDTMLAAYLADDLAGIAVAATEHYASADPATERMLNELIVERNHRMAERVLPLLEEHPHLIAIGALHLPGAEGVLNLLAEQGWTVVPADL